MRLRDSTTLGHLNAPDRRTFLKECGACILALGLGSIPTLAGARIQKGRMVQRPSPHFTPLTGDTLRCDLCPRACEIPEGGRGYCRTRVNRSGRGYTSAYGNPCAVNLDPIERLSFLHVLPGTRFLSVATAGCTFHCSFCENWSFSQAAPQEVFTYDLPPSAAVKRALSMKASGIAYAYVEPTVFYDYMLDTSRLAKAQGLLNVIHTNGFINPKPLQALIPSVDAAQVDLKSFKDSFYKDLCDGRLTPVLETLKRLSAEGVHLEITNLIIPGKNDDPSTIRAMCDWIAEKLDPHTPLHFARFYPVYRLTRLAPTPVSTLEQARDQALASGLRHVYIANVPGHPAWNTFCPGCKQRLILRKGYIVEENHIQKAHCTFCGKLLPGLWDISQSRQKTH